MALNTPDTNNNLDLFDDKTVQQILNNATAMIYLTDSNGRYLYANRHFLNLLELPIERVVGFTAGDLFGAANTATIERNNAEVIASKRSMNFEELLELVKGPRTFLSNKFPLLDDEGEIYAVCGLSSDITDRKKIELGLQNATLALTPNAELSVFETLVQHMATALEMDCALIAEMMPDGSSVSLLALSIDGSLVEPFTYPLAGTPCMDVIRLGQPVAVLDEVNTVYPDSQVDFGIGAKAYLAYPLTDSSGTIHGLIAVMRSRPLIEGEVADHLMKIFAARASAELDTLDYQASLQASEEQYRSIFNASLDGLAIYNKDGAVIECNPAFAAMHGLDEADVEQLNIQQFIPPESMHFHQQFVEKVSNGEILEFEAVALRKDGSQFYTEIKGVPIHYQGKLHLMSMQRDISERKHKEAALTKSENVLRATVESALDCIISTDREGRIVTFNPAAEATFGYSRDNVIGRKLDDMFIPERYRTRHREGMAHCLATGKSRLSGETMTLSALRADGSEFPCELAVVMSDSDEGPIFVGFLRDISSSIQAEQQRKELENQLHQAQKMEAIGQLTGGMAHDFNNILTTMLGYTAMSLEVLGTEDNDNANKYLSRIKEAGERARDLIQQMLIFSRGQQGDREQVTLGPMVLDSLRLLSAGLPDTLHFKTRIEDPLAAVEATRVQLEQVLLNLCINARDVMPQGGEVLISVRGTRDAEIQCSSCKQMFSAQAFVVFAVTDDGTGIESEHLEHIFDPFYSTKEIKAGSGMGLATSHGIVHSHGGHIVVESTPGRGACFSVYLPALASTDHHNFKTNAPSTNSEPEVEQVSARVLIVDDEPAVLEFMCDMLNSRGFQVLSAINGEDALNIYERDNTIDIVITDLALPKMSGLSLASQLTSLDSSLPVILYTGYDEDISPQDIKRAGIQYFTHKPVDIDVLSAEITHLLRIAAQPPEPQLE
jgi:PAS domain S-box-containing protein